MSLAEERAGKPFQRPYWLLFSVNLLLSLTLYLSNPLMNLRLNRAGIEAGTAGAVIGSMSLASLLFRPFSGWVCDRFRRKSLLLIFTLLTAVSLGGYGAVNHAALFFLLRILHGVSFGVTTTVTMACVSDYLPEGKEGQGMGVFAVGQSIAAALGPSAGLTMRSFWGEEGAFLAAALVSGLSLLLELSLPGGDAPRERGGAEPLSGLIAREAVPYALLTIALSAANGVESGYLASYAVSLGMENAGWYFTLSAITLFLARLFLGKWGDRMGFSAVFYPSAALIAFSFLLLAWLPGGAAVPIMAVSSVTKALGVGALQPAIQARCLAGVPPERRGAASCTYYIGADLGQGGASAVAGGVLASSGYSGVFLWAAAPLAFSAILYGACRRYMTKRKKDVSL